MNVDGMKLAAAMQLIAEAIQGGAEAAQQEAVVSQTAPQQTASQQTAPQQAATVTPIAAAGMYGTAPTMATAQQSLPLEDTYREIQLCLQQLWQRDGDTSGPDLLARYGVTGLSQLPKERYGDLLTELRGMLGGQA